jgi:hypothetical protein
MDLDVSENDGSSLSQQQSDITDIEKDAIGEIANISMERQLLLCPSLWEKSRDNNPPRLI